MPIMLPSGIDIRIREDLASGAGRTQTTLIIDPIITIDGHRVLMTDIGDKGFGKIEQGTPREELISWTGITDNGTTYTLTGVTWGINFYNLTGSVQANKYRHISGSTFRITTDMHFIAEQYRDKDNNVFESSDDFDIKANELKLGDGTDDHNKVITAQNGDAHEPFIEYNETTGKWNISNDGVNSYDPEQGGSGVTAGDGIDIVGGEVSVDVDEIVDDEALTVVGNRIKTVVNEDTGLFKDVNGINIDVIDPDNPVAQSNGSLVGGSNVVLSNLESVGAGDNNGAFKVSINGVVYDNISIDLSGETSIIQDTGESTNITYDTNWNCQSFTAPINQNYISSIDLYLAEQNPGTFDVTASLFLSDGNDKPTGTSIKDVTINQSSFSGTGYVNFTFNQLVSPGTKYVVVLKEPGTSDYAYSTLWYRHTSSLYSGGVSSTSSNSGSSWTNKSYDFRFKINFDISQTSIADKMQSSIRTATSSTETVAWDTDHFVITSAYSGRQSSVLKLSAPSIGTDISVAGYLDLGANATEVPGNGDDYKLVRLNEDGVLPSEILDGVDGSGLTNLSPVFGNFTKSSSSTDATVIAHGLGRTPQFVRLKSIYVVDNDVIPMFSDGAFNGTSQYCIYSKRNPNGGVAGGGASTSHAIVLGRANNTAGEQLAGVVSVDATNITITWSKTGSPNTTYTVFWEAN